jgi:hypothetical protein
MKWGELECNAMKAIAASCKHELFNNGQAASIILRQVRYLPLWDAILFLSCVKAVIANADVQAEVASRTGLSALLRFIRPDPILGDLGYEKDALTMLTYSVTTPQRKETLWEVGGIDILMDIGRYEEAAALFPTHSHAALLKFARTRSAAMREAMPAYATSDLYKPCIALLDRADKAVEAETAGRGTST